MNSPAGLPAQSESDINGTPQRDAWQRAHLDARSRELTGVSPVKLEIRL